MALYDGMSEELTRELQELEVNLDEVTRKAFTSVIDEEVKAYERNVRDHTPQRTGGLKNSFKVTNISSSKWHGYKAEFEGDAPNGEPYEKIANVLNYGKPADDHSGAIAGTHFIASATRKLKGMNERIEARIAAEIAKLT